MIVKRPPSVLAVGVLGIILGALGVCNGCGATASQLGKTKVVEMNRDFAMRVSRGNPGADLDTQLALQRRINEISEPYKPAMIANAILNVLASLMLIAVSALALAGKPIAAPLFLVTAAGHALVDVSILAIGLIVQIKASAVLSEYMDNVSANPALPLGASRTLGAVMESSRFFGMCLGFGWLAVKVAYYVFGAVVLRKPEAREYFAVRA